MTAKTEWGVRGSEKSFYPHSGGLRRSTQIVEKETMYSGQSLLDNLQAGFPAAFLSMLWHVPSLPTAPPNTEVDTVMEASTQVTGRSSLVTCEIAHVQIGLV
jgi:hypothetical protein